MYYLIQKNVFQDPRYDEIFRVLEALKLPYEIVNFEPNSHSLNFKTKRKDIFVYGSVKLAKIVVQFHWKPGSFYGNNHEFEKYAAGFGQHVLNFGSSIYSFGENFSWPEKELFIKPSVDAKAFTGKVFSKPEWEDFVYYNLNTENTTSVNAALPIQISQHFTIIKEARIWIVNKKIVTSSYYLFHGDVAYEETVSEEGLAFAKEMTHLYNVAAAYVMDICKTPKGWKIVEVNCINSAGFYKADVQKIILALEAFYG